MVNMRWMCRVLPPFAAGSVSVALAPTRLEEVGEYAG